MCPFRKEITGENKINSSCIKVCYISYLYYYSVLLLNSQAACKLCNGKGTCTWIK